MLCDNCGKNQATVRYTQIINGDKTELNLCAQCAAESEANLFGNLSLGNFLVGMLGGRSQNEEDREETALAPCPVCGFTFERFLKQGMLGCEHCYKHFENQIMPIIRRIHGGVLHTGKTPGAELLQSEKPERAEDAKLSELKSKLKEAVAMEEYERAAKLRDEIKEIESAGKGV